MKEGANWRYVSFVRTVTSTKGLDANVRVFFLVSLT